MDSVFEPLRRANEGRTRFKKKRQTDFRFDD